MTHATRHHRTDHRNWVTQAPRKSPSSRRDSNHHHSRARLANNNVADDFSFLSILMFRVGCVGF